MQVAAAERAFALIELWGNAKAVVANARAILDGLWEASVAPTAAITSRLAARVKSLPDATVNDPELPHQTALEALFNAARILGGIRHPHDLMTPQLFGEIDYWARVRAGGSRVRIVDPRNPPPAGPFEAEEEKRLRRDQDAAGLRETPSRSRALLRERADDERRDLVSRLKPLVAFSRDPRRR